MAINPGKEPEALVVVLLVSEGSIDVVTVPVAVVVGAVVVRVVFTVKMIVVFPTFPTASTATMVRL